jgi:hypothetical protein
MSSEENKYWHYGCYLNKKKYKWECKNLNNENEATNYTLNKINGDGFSIYTPLPKWIPGIFHQYIITNIIKRAIRVEVKN